MVYGEELYFESTKVDANTAMTSMIDRTEYEADQHLEKLWEHDERSKFSGLVDKYNGERLIGLHKPSYKRVTDEKISLTDPDAAPMRGQGGGSAVLGYRDHYVIDGGKSRIILSALVTPASVMDNTPMLDLVGWVCSLWRLTPIIVGLEERGFKAFLI